MAKRERWCLCERGNTLLYDDDGNMVAYLDTPDGKTLEVSLTPGNYPALYVNEMSKSEVKSLPKHLKQLIADGWEASKLNHPVQE